MVRTLGYVGWFLLAVSPPIATAQSRPPRGPGDSQTVVFVCDHGTVKSVVAMAYFAKLARERQLPLRAISRGTNPEAKVPALVLDGLRSDGLNLSASFTPTKFSTNDFSNAIAVISFDQPSVAELVAGRLPTAAWDGMPAISENYRVASEAIRHRVENLVDSLARQLTPLRLVQTIPLQGVAGRIDHLSVDLKGQRLFVAALGNNSVEVIDLAQGKRIHSITGLAEPQGLVYIAGRDQLIVANGGDGSVRAFDGKTYAPLGAVSLGGDADNVRFDPSSGRIVVGYGDGALGFLDSGTHGVLGRVKLPAHPESFQLEKSRPRIYVNLPDAGQIAVVDGARQSVLATWPMAQLRANFPMALDESHHRLLVVTRSPAKLVVLDTESGKQVTTLGTSSDADDVFLDQQNQRLYISAGEGYLDVIRQTDADHYQALSRIATAPGARTSLFVPELGRLFLAVPHRGAQQAAVRVYEVLK